MAVSPSSAAAGFQCRGQAAEDAVVRCVSDLPITWVGGCVLDDDIDECSAGIGGDFERHRMLLVDSCVVRVMVTPDGAAGLAWGRSCQRPRLTSTTVDLLNIQ